MYGKEGKPYYRQQYDLAEDELQGALAIVEVTRKDPKDAVDGAQQSFKDDVDINVIARRMGVTDGAILPQAIDPKYFGDFSEVQELRDMLDGVRTAQERFLQLPWQLRQRFNHDPAELWSFVNDPKNHDDAIKLGILHKKAAPAPETPLAVRVVNAISATKPESTSTSPQTE